MIAFAAAQLVPYRITNPAARREPTWTSAKGRALVVASCFDCHSNQSRTFWYSKIAPISWWTANHVNDGRATLNFSEWPQRSGEGDLAESVTGGSMPPSYYTWFGLHRDAKFSASDKAALVAELQAVAAQAGGSGRRGGGG